MRSSAGVCIIAYHVYIVLEIQPEYHEFSFRNKTLVWKTSTGNRFGLAAGSLTHQQTVESSLDDGNNKQRCIVNFDSTESNLLCLFRGITNILKKYSRCLNFRSCMALFSLQIHQERLKFGVSRTAAIFYQLETCGKIKVQPK